jgi:hypothetical protein
MTPTALPVAGQHNCHHHLLESPTIMQLIPGQILLRRRGRIAVQHYTISHRRGLSRHPVPASSHQPGNQPTTAPQLRRQVEAAVLSPLSHIRQPVHPPDSNTASRWGAPRSSATCRRDRTEHTRTVQETINLDQLSVGGRPSTSLVEESRQRWALAWE